MRLLSGVLEHHDHAAFELHAFAYGPAAQDEMRRRIAAACDAFHEVSELSGRALAERIRAEAIDILIDLTGWTGNSRTAALAFRPAPIQINWLGYTGTLGSRVLADYLIGDPLATPAEQQPNFAEALALLPACCQPNDAGRRIGPPRSRADEGLPERGFVFCCFSRPLKITPRVFACWCDLLDRVAGSVLWLLAANDTAKANLKAAARRRGIDPARLVFSAARPPEEHLARLALADLALDTFPFGSHTNASDALWAGLPVVTVRGETFPGRVTASMLRAIGLDELAAASLDGYRALALSLARDPGALRALRARLAENRLSSPLFDTAGFARALEALLRGIWRRHCTGEATPAAPFTGP
jgi:predicted O-linked N-acetylglucosamine transferase (SPINDLY family)